MTVTRKVRSKKERAFPYVRWALRCQKVPEGLIALVMALYSNAKARVRTLVGTSDDFGIGEVVHQGSALSPLLFVVVM